MRGPITHLLAISLLYLCLGCNPNGKVEIFLLKPSDDLVNNDPLDPTLVSHIRIHVRGKGMTPREKTYPFVPGGALKLIDIPVGDGRVITVEGLGNQDDDHPLSRGRTLPMGISRGHQKVALLMARLRSFSHTPDNGLNDARFAHSTVLAENGDLFFVGGAESGDEDTPEELLSSVEVFDPVSGKTTVLDCDGDDTHGCLPSARALAAAAPVSDGFVFLGGLGEDGLLDTVDLVDTRLGMVETQDTLSSKRTHATSLVLDNATLVVGGKDISGDATNAVEVINREGEISKASLPEPRWGMAATGIRTVGFFFGGYDRNGNTSNSYILYHAATDRVAMLPSEVEPRAFASAVTLSDNKVLVIGGLREDGSASTSIDLFDPRRLLLCHVGDLDVGRWHAAAVTLLDGRVLVTGGLQGNTPGEVTFTTRILDARYLELGDSCTAYISGRLNVGDAAPARYPRYMATALQFENEVVALVGGRDPSGDPIKQIEIYIPDE